MLILLLFLLGTAACSTLRKPLQPQAKVNADATLLMAQQQQRQGQVQPALASYQFAYEQYKSFGDSAGKLSALSGIARISHDLGDSTLFDTSYQEMEDIVQNVVPEQSWQLLVLELSILKRESRYWQILEKTVEVKGFPEIAELQILAHRVQAAAYLQSADPAAAKRLHRLAKKLDKRLPKSPQADPDAVSQAWYALAYHYYLQSDYSQAEDCVRRSAGLDYLYGNFSSLGYSLWLQAQIAVKRQNDLGAIALLKRALDIFASAGNSALLEKITEQIDILKRD